MSEDIVAKMAVGPTAEGVLIANNIFYLRGRSPMVKGDQFSADHAADRPLPRACFENNLFLRADNWPAAVGITDRAPLLGDHDEVLRAGDIAFDLGRREASVAGSPVRLSPRELGVLEHLLRHAGQACELRLAGGGGELG